MLEKDAKGVNVGVMKVVSVDLRAACAWLGLGWVRSLVGAIAFIRISLRTSTRTPRNPNQTHDLNQLLHIAEAQLGHQRQAPHLRLEGHGDAHLFAGSVWGVISKHDPNMWADDGSSKFVGGLRLTGHVCTWPDFCGGDGLNFQARLICSPLGTTTTNLLTICVSAWPA